jgi:hypothetical protein
MNCPQCHHDVPALDYCVRCGFPLGVDALDTPGRRSGRHRYGAAPREQAWAPHVLSTIFPQLPERDLRFFGVAAVLGIAVTAGLTIARFFPLALILACVVVPLLLLLYLFAVDIYEDEPVRVLALTAFSGAIVGVVLGLVVQRVDAPARALGIDLGDSNTRILVVILPLVGGALALAGPLVLLRYRRFNDVLDGATFGSVSGVTLAAAQTLVGSWAIVSGGFRPRGATGPWLVHLTEIGVLVTLVWAGAIGSAAAAFWLRYRAPVRDRHALGPFGSPPVALVVAAVLLVAAPASIQAWGQNRAFPALVALAAIAMLLLRRTIHLGLLEEADEIEIGDPVVCANCHRVTPLHTFCGHCGISLRALPKDRSVPASEGSDGTVPA